MTNTMFNVTFSLLTNRKANSTAVYCSKTQNKRRKRWNSYIGVITRYRLFGLMSWYLFRNQSPVRYPFYTYQTKVNFRLFRFTFSLCSPYSNVYFINKHTKFYCSTNVRTSCSVEDQNVNTFWTGLFLPKTDHNCCQKEKKQ